MTGCGFSAVRRANHLACRFSVVQPLAKKYSGFLKPQIGLYPFPSTPPKGRIAIVTDARLDAMDASGASDESAQLADGEVVWS